MGTLYWEDHPKPNSRKIQTKFPGVFEYLWIQWKGRNIIIKASMTAMMPSIMANLYRILLLAQELYSASPTTPRITIIAAKIKFSIKQTKKKILAKLCVNRVTTIASKLRPIIKNVTIWPTRWNVYSHAVAFIYESLVAIKTWRPIWK